MTERTLAKRPSAKARPSDGKAAAAPPPSGTKSADARQRIISVAEALFTQRGFEGTSMRDIAAAAKMNVASSYYYFPSKEELLWAVWQKGGLELLARARSAIDGIADPWKRMEAACVAHVSGLLDWRRANQILFVMPPWQYPEGMRDKVIALRDEYERILADLIEELPLRKGVDRHQLRLMLLGALSWSLYWYKPGGDTPAAIARSMLDMIRAGVERSSSEVRPRKAKGAKV
jgi:AcrR family transcriptional regulator